MTEVQLLNPHINKERPFTKDLISTLFVSGIDAVYVPVNTFLQNKIGGLLSTTAGVLLLIVGGLIYLCPLRHFWLVCFI